MKIEKIGKRQYIVLEENDRIFLTTPEKLDDADIEITRKDDGISISGDSSLVKSIRGDGMLEKVYIQPVVSSQEIIEKCDKWLEMFRKIHDKFRELVLSEKYKKQHIVMMLSFTSFISLSNENIKGRTINLNLKQYNTIIQEGVTISIDEETEKDIYAYLVANVLEYYISQNYVGEEIDDLKDWDWHLHSIETPQDGESVPIFSNLSLLREIPEYEKIVISIIGNHNVGLSSNQLISNLRNKISDRQLSDRIDKSINYSTNQYEHIFDASKENQGPVLNRTLNPDK